jgi:hypothetical protein
MVAAMKRFALALALTATAGPALADPLADALKAGGGKLCFTRSYDSAWLKAHHGQTIREARFTLTNGGPGGDFPTLRMSLQGPGKPIYAFGACEWWGQDINRGVNGKVLDPTFKKDRGLECHMMTDTTGVSAEEGGDFPVEWGNGRFVQVHMGGAITGWRSFNTKPHATVLDLAPADSIFRLDRAPLSSCSELLTKFAP